MAYILGGVLIQIPYISEQIRAIGATSPSRHFTTSGKRMGQVGRLQANSQNEKATNDEVDGAHEKKSTSSFDASRRTNLLA
jgi:hypothetical protein